MRPVNKGTNATVFTQWHQARDPLVLAIGAYCSYCEMAVNQMIEIEHIVPRHHGGAELAWENFLLACKYCNTCKSNDNTTRSGYLWPDVDNVDLALAYNKVSAVNILPGTAVTVEALATINLAKINRMPHTPNVPTVKDLRYVHRLKAWEYAERCKVLWDDQPDAHTAEIISIAAMLGGFYSVWTTVFAESPEVLAVIRGIFPGTFVELENDGSRRRRTGSLI